VNRGSGRTLVVYVAVLAAIVVAAAPVGVMIVASVGMGQAYSGTPRSSSVFELPYTFLCYSSGFTIGPTIAQLHRPDTVFRILYGHPGLVVVIAVFTAVFLVGMIQVIRESRLAVWLIPWLVIPPALVYLTALIFPDLTYQVRYTFASLPAFTMILAVGVSALGPRVRPVFAGAIVVLSLYSLSNLYWAERYDRADVRGAVKHIISAQERPRQVVVAGQIRDVLPHYAAREDAVSVVFCGSSEYEGHGFIDVARGRDQSLGKEIDVSHEAWLVAGRDWIGDHEMCLEILSDYYEPVEHDTLTGVEVWRLEPRSNSS
jgi:hypothetical protein